MVLTTEVEHGRSNMEESCTQVDKGQCDAGIGMVL
jgi:hypothetical protein